MGALFTSLFELSDAFVEHFAPNPRGFFESAREHIAEKRTAELAALREIQGTSAGPYR